jgi:hypothetical protein
MGPSIAHPPAGRLEANGRAAAAHIRRIARVADEVVTRELHFKASRRRRAALRDELQQVCVELGLGCEIEERVGLRHARLLVLVRGTERDVAALADYARVRGWETWSPARPD